ncbi:PTS lactose/cellobiose transporter subunit IIA [Fictibacillus phosphorivorans]|uniref:PTS lactose/cellobiose transporter subunit IIA n=1 Tax=Fictibacillus phosphorivorans TaxID=1221500 RepID=UPI00203C27CE|nr:PTS lactose/cellobiose transporter subunit IIA [Fictibacillus phosphorivorans]MCM3717697.1 PTS lactose/cellobiose transporter subunit IIA [Fictibacillus phosphorivorans]MCM3775597.1 PTS lactose/cellobiose transporter subunit IIA [Fictibacillus phosphorivorans]
MKTDVDITSFMPLITESAQAKKHAFEALNCAKEGDQEGYNEKIALSKEFLLAAHKEQTNVLSLNAREEEVPVTVYLIHAMDHVSNAQMVHDLVKELAELHLNKCLT